VQVGSLTATTGPDGSYTLKGVPRGKQQVRLSAPGFRYISLSVEAFQPAERPVAVTVEKDTRRDWGLMQGFLTLPFVKDTPFSIGRYYDHDPTEGHVLWWNGNSYDYNNQPGKGYDDNHTGTDFDAEQGTLVVAAAPGYVAAVYSTSGGSNVVEIQHPNSFYTVYHHLSEFLVKEGQQVTRGTPIGKVGMSGTFYPHLHFEFGPRGNALDPYVPIFPSKGYWHWDPSSQRMIWFTVKSDTNPNMLGYWTETNTPHFP
jgi:murein DD-endopeptidase MepM/ murein hydrolase activator NlpD